MIFSDQSVTAFFEVLSRARDRFAPAQQEFLSGCV
jgi:hypothetical protein